MRSFIICKDKAVPQHTYGGAGGKRRYTSTHSQPRYYVWVSGQRHAAAAFYPRGRDPPGIHCTGGWLGPRAGLDTEQYISEILYVRWLRQTRKYASIQLIRKLLS
jgi:hypothetical protein